MTFEVVRAGARVVAGQVRLFADAAVLARTRQTLVKILVAAKNFMKLMLAFDFLI